MLTRYPQPHPKDTQSKLSTMMCPANYEKCKHSTIHLEGEKSWELKVCPSVCAISKLIPYGRGEKCLNAYKIAWGV